MASMRQVINFEVSRNLRKKSFWYAALAPPLIILAIIGISTASANSAKKSSAQQAQSATKNSKIAIFDGTGLINTGQLSKQKIIIEPDKQAGINAVENGQLDAFFFYPKAVTKNGISVYAQDKGVSKSDYYNAAAQQILTESIVASLKTSARSDQAVQILQKTPTVTDTTYKNGQPTLGLARIIAPGVFLLAFLALLVLLAVLLVSSTTEEKENRTAEILLTSIKARSLILGKILSIFILGLIEAAVIIVPLLIYYGSSSGHTLPGGVSLAHVPLDAKAIAFGTLFFLSGFALFSGWLVGISSLFPSAQDAGRYLGLTFIWAYIPIYTLSYVISSPNATIVTVFTYFPLTAPTTALLRNAVGTISTAEALGALAVIVVAACLTTGFAIRSFRYGAMEYGRRISLKEIFSREKQTKSSAQPVVK